MRSSKTFKRLGNKVYLLTMNYLVIFATALFLSPALANEELRLLCDNSVGWYNYYDKNVRQWEQNNGIIHEIVQKHKFIAVSPSSTFDLLIKLEKKGQPFLLDTTAGTNITNNECTICFENNSDLFYDGCGATFCHRCYEQFRDYQDRCPKCRGHHNVFSANSFLLDTTALPFRALRAQLKTNFTPVIDRAISVLSSFQNSTETYEQNIFSREFFENLYFLFAFPSSFQNPIQLAYFEHIIHHMMSYIHSFHGSFEFMRNLKQITYELKDNFLLLDEICTVYVKSQKN